MTIKYPFVIASLVIISLSCTKLVPGLPEENSVLDGPIEGLSGQENLRFIRGDKAFNAEVFTPSTGLGPVFVATSCGSCHAGDGKGHPFSTLTRFGQSDSTGNKFLTQGGPQLQNRAIPGFYPEQIPAGATFSRFTPPANTGLGFLEALTDEQILANSDPYDSNNDGISGRPNYVEAPWFFEPKAHHQANGGKYIGRFGKKAATLNLLHQTVNAYHQDMGISSYYMPFDVYSGQHHDPEVATEVVNDLVFYLQTLKAPVPRNISRPDVQRGKQVFNNIGCENCHKAEWETGTQSILGLSNKKFYPYTDLLLHDMGSGLDDGYTEGRALSSEWRTPPLWGLGLSKNSQGGEYFLLHDGRAKSIQSAIEWHGGEASQSKLRFMELSNQEKSDLINFLESL